MTTVAENPRKISRIAKNPVKLPAGVNADFKDHVMVIKGKLGELKQPIPRSMAIDNENGELQIRVVKEDENTLASSGTMRALIQNMVTGVTEGFTKKLLLVGVGYRAKVQGSALDLTLGFSHPLVMQMPKGITVETPSNTEIILKGVDKQLVGQVAANIRAKRPPEPYKGKGIRYADEKIIQKEGKKK